MKVHELIGPSSSDKGAKEMSLPSFYTNKSIGAKKSVRKEKVTVKDSKTGTVYGRRTVLQKST